MQNIIKMFRFDPKYLFVTILFSSIFLSACKDDITPPPAPPVVNKYDTLTNFQGLVVPTTGKIKVNVNYVFGKDRINLNTGVYQTLGGDTFTLSLIRHYFSNLTLIGPDAKVNLGNYQLINAAEDAGKTFEISNVPAGLYHKIGAILGVDSIRNTSGLQEGALDPAYGMFWTWATGYIFIKVEGRTTDNQTFGFHLGGINLTPYNEADITAFKVKSTTPTINLDIDIKEFFEGPYAFSFKKDSYNAHSPTEPANDKLLGNMKDMIKVVSIE